MKAFLLSLPDSRQRRLSAIRNIRISSLPFEIVDGVEADKLKPETLPATDAGRELLPGEIGCYAAHVRALQRIIDYGLEWAYVLEDDFRYLDDPSFGLVEIADVLPESFDYIAIYETYGFNPNYRRVRREGAFWRTRETDLLATGYLAHRRLAEVVLEHHSLCEMPIDHLYAELSRSMNFFETNEPIIGIAKELGSDIHNTSQRTGSPERR